MKSVPLFIWVGVLGIFACAYGAWYSWRQYREADEMVEAAQLPPLTEFTLTDSRGQEFHSRSLGGQVWVASFFYSSCPGPCRIMNRNILRLQHELGDIGVRFVSITSNPESDTPAALTAYARANGFDKNPERWIFLTGDFAYIQRVSQDIFHLSLPSQSQHSDRLLLIDRAGSVVPKSSSEVGFDATSDANVAALKKRLAKLLGESP